MNLPPAARVLLLPASWLYATGAALRARLYASGVFKRQRLKGAVISVGNLTVGGTGKTPMVIWLAQNFLSQGRRVAILTRGYRGSHGTSDEIELMKHRLQNRVAFGIGKNRFEQGRRLESQSPIDVFLLDDGFQHLKLARDLDIVLLDATQPLSVPLLPAGPMREKPSALKRAGAVVFTRAENVPGAHHAIQKLSSRAVFSATTKLSGFRKYGSAESLLLNLNEIQERPFFAFCGIGNPQAFCNDLKNWGLPIAGHKLFRDHHRYSAGDAAALQRAAEKCGAAAFVTTEKDLYNLGKVILTKFPLYIAIIDVAVSPEAQFLALVNDTLKSRCEPLS